MEHPNLEDPKLEEMSITNVKMAQDSIAQFFFRTNDAIRSTRFRVISAAPQPVARTPRHPGGSPQPSRRPRRSVSWPIGSPGDPASGGWGWVDDG